MIDLEDEAHPVQKRGLICGDGEAIIHFLQEARMPPADLLVYTGAFLAATDPLDTQRLNMVSIIRTFGPYSPFLTQLSRYSVPRSMIGCCVRLQPVCKRQAFLCCPHQHIYTME